MIHLIDASVWVAAGDKEDPSRASARDLLADPRADHAALDLTVLEVINTQMRARLPARAISVSDEVYQVTQGRVIGLSRSEHISVEDLCSECPLTSYDGAYVVAAATRRMKLVSLDMKDLVEPGWAVTPEQALEALAA